MTVLTAVLVVLPGYLFQRAAAVADGDPGIGGASAAPCFNLRTENLLRGVVRRSEIFHGRATRRLADVEVGAPFGGALTEVDRAPTVVVSRLRELRRHRGRCHRKLEGGDRTALAGAGTA